MCDHEKTIEEDFGYYDMDGDWVPDIRLVTVGTWSDIDLHRFRCTQCGLVRYYSERARRYYEDGEGELP